MREGEVPRLPDVSAKIVGMRAECTEEKWDRIARQIQNALLNAHPNPEREGCPGLRVVVNYAKRVANFDDVKDEAEYQHITHCSLCYVGFLDAREQLRASQEVSGGPTKRLPRPVEKKIGRTLDRLEQVMKSVAERR
jgi:hypothetical protein